MDILVGDETPKPNKPDERDLCREFDETPKPEMKEISVGCQRKS